MEILNDNNCGWIDYNNRRENIKTLDKDGYTSIQLASIDGKSEIKKTKKPTGLFFCVINNFLSTIKITKKLNKK